MKGKVKWYSPRNGYEFFEGEDSDKRLSVIPSDFRKNDRLEVELHPESSRMGLYKL
jgi:cold shock CspA family protein